MNEVIEMNNVKKEFGNKTVLSDISFSVGKGQIFGLLGPSGAGKTTIINILTGQIRPTDGTAKLLGFESAKLADGIYNKIGMVLDESGVYNRLSVADNMIMFADIYGVNRKHIKEVIDKVGLLDAMKKPVETLSKGMKQRLVLARAILHSPELLFLDEPTSGLDPATALRIHELIREQQKRGCTIFLTTHNMEEATAMCETIILLNEGSIVERGVPLELCRKYNKDNLIYIMTKEGKELKLDNNQSSAKKITHLFSENQVESIHSSEPNLETVFITLTGRKLV